MNTFADIPISIQESDQPLFIQLYESMRDAISDGRLSPGATLPPTRDLARKLGVSRHTIMKAVKLLVTQGYIDSSENRLQVFESSAEQLATDAHRYQTSAEFSPLPADTLSNFAQNVFSRKELSHAEVERGTMPDQSFILDAWCRLISQHARAELMLQAKSNPLGYEPLREELCKYLNRFRSLRCCADNTVIFSNSQEALNFICKLTLNPADRIIVENPGSQAARKMFEAYEAQLESVDVDGDGMLVESLRHIRESAKLLHVTPAHQLPTGATLSLERRQQLLDWCQQTGTLILEDGFDSEYWHKGRPLPPLQGLDNADSVIHLASFERLLYPASTIAFVVFPYRLMPAVQKLKETIGGDVSLIEQIVLGKFLERGLVERNLRRNQRLLSNRRQHLVIALMKAFGQRLSISKESSGTNLLLRFNDCSNELIEQAARDCGFPMISTSSYYMRSTNRKEYLLPFATIDEESLMTATAAFADRVGKIEKQPSAQIDFHAETTPAELTVFELDDPFDLARLNDSRPSNNFAAHRTGNGVTTP